MRELKKQLVLRWDEILMVFALEAGMFLFGEILLAVMVTQTHKIEDTVFELGTLMAVVTTIFIFVIMGMSSLALCFNIGVGFGSVRRRFVSMFLLNTFLEFLAAALFACLLHHLDLFILQNAYPGLENEFNMGRILQWNYILVAGIAAVGIHALFGSLFLKYGRIAFIIFWVIWIAGMGTISRMSHILAKYQHSAIGQFVNHIIQFFAKIPETSILSAISVVSFIMVIVAWLLLRKQQVTM